MGKFNSKTSSLSKTTNLAGGEAYKQTSKLQFVSILLTSFVQDKFYSSAKEELARFGELIKGIADKKFVAKAAIFARTKFGMRSITHVAAAEIAKIVKGEKWTKNFITNVIYRPDDITEIMAYYNSVYGKPYPNCLKKGLAKAFDKFDAYQLAKYRGEKNAVSLVDAVNYLHPKPNKKNSKALSDLVKGTLRSVDTWESKLTKAGQESTTEKEKEEMKASAWKELILEKKIGYFALLRNLRNILEQAPEMVSAAIETLTNEELIKKSLVLPFRYLSAIEELSKVHGSQSLLIAINKALDISVKNVPKFDGKTIVVLDTSASMQGNPLKIGSLFSAILVKSNECDFMTFDISARYQTLNPMDSTLSIAKSIVANGGSTNFRDIFRKLKCSYDRIIILSDMQAWVGYNSPVADFNEYKKKFNINPNIYSFDLAGYGTMQFPEKNVYCLSGWSEKIFDIMVLLEQDRDALINEIEKIDL